jgi:hypothetical protein
MVLVDRALIYSDQEMTSAIGYVSRGKKLVVGEIPRNRAQVYPIIVSGKIAYIRVLDVTTEKESMDTNRLVAERFQQTAQSEYKSKLAFAYYAFSSQISIKEQNSEIADKDILLWNGLSFRGEVLIKNSFDLQVIANYMGTSVKKEIFRAMELGFGAAYRLIDKRKFLARVEVQLLAIPYSSYSVGKDVQVNSYGYTAGAGLNLTYLFNQHWGAELTGGVYQTNLLTFDTPAPYKSISPSFVGNRLGLGINYTY